MPRRLIEEAFPLQKVSADSKHEKNVRHGHISTLHIWPARRPLAACRAVTIATLLPDPADAPETIKAEYTRLSGSPLPDKQREYLCNELIASLTRWGDEKGKGNWTEKDRKGRWVNKLHIARELIQMAYNGRPPKVMDMFAGGGAIPLEAMRLGCEVIANDYNPVAWFLLKCTLEYPQRFTGKIHKLPSLNLDESLDLKKGDLASHVRLWGQWVLENARCDLASYYPVIDEKPTVAYLWARTIPCQDPRCGGTIPLLKTLWVCQKAEKTLPDIPENRNRPDFLRLKETKRQTKVIINGKRALKLCLDFKAKCVRFEIFVPKETQEVGKPTMSGATANCPFCGSQQPSDYIKRCGHEGKLRSQMTAVVYQEEYGREYRPPTQTEIDAAKVSKEMMEAIDDKIPHGIPDEPLPNKERHRAVGSQLPDYGFKTWSDLFTTRQLLTLMICVKWTRMARTEMEILGYSAEWVEAIEAYLAINIDRLASYNSTICWWQNGRETMAQTYVRFALPITWDFAELNPFSKMTGGYLPQIGWVVRFLENVLSAKLTSVPSINQQSSCKLVNQVIDGIITDPPYYDAIPYSDLADFFYVWLRRSIGDQFQSKFNDRLTPKSEELVQQHKTGEKGRIGKQFYENGMVESFQVSHNSLCDDGRMVIVFAHKDPAAWETLTTAMISAGLVVTASWPIDTEMQGGLRSQVASLATSLWLVCRKRPTNARTGHYSKVKQEMQERITERLRYFWDAGIQGPDFVWAAIGPALESYSSYKEVRRMDGQAFTVVEFLTEVRRIVSDFALGQILHGGSTEAVDEWTRYYLMHRNHFGKRDAPVGECILLAGGYGLSLDDLKAARIGILKNAASGNALRLLEHTDRRSDRVGQAHGSGELPMIDMLHRIMNLWDAGDKIEINTYLAEHGLHENDLFKSVIQALIETSPQSSDERSLLETLINYEPGQLVSTGGSGQSTKVVEQQLTFKFEDISS